MTADCVAATQSTACQSQGSFCFQVAQHKRDMAIAAFLRAGNRLSRRSTVSKFPLPALVGHRSFASGDEQDLIVVGGGPGGYVAAIKAAQLGLKVTCVEGRGKLGGTCLNVGCIPSKALLKSSELYHSAKKDAEKHGVIVEGVSLDLGKMMKQKDTAVDGLTKGIEFLFKKNKVDYKRGWGQFTKEGLDVETSDGNKESLKAKNYIIATGSEVAPLKGIELDEERIVSSTGALALKEVPKSLVVIGGGYIGLEMGSVWSRLGAKVTVVEFLDKIVPNMDGEIRKAFQRTLTKQGFKFKLGYKVLSAKNEGKTVKLELEPAKGGKQEVMEADVVLVSAGRRPFLGHGLGLEAVGVELDDRGRILVDEKFKTKAPAGNIFAIGDVIPGPMLAHKAEEDGVACVENLAGKVGHVNYATVPGIVYTHPEVASVGLTEEQAKEQKLDYKTGKFPFAANSRAKCVEDAEGLVKFVADAKTDKILGAHIMGPAAGELIQQCVLAMEYGASSEDIARTCHGHPTFSEAVKEAALATCSSAIHA